MKKITLLLRSHFLVLITIWLSLVIPSNSEEDRELISWETKKLSADFYGEGAFHGDFNKDGAVM